MDKKSIALNYFNSGKNCCQSVVLAFKEEFNLDEQTLDKLSMPFGGGFARLRLVCGAVSGMAMVISNKFTNSDGTNKTEVYSIVQQACKEFEKEAGSIICGELLDGITNDKSPNAEPRTAEYYKKRPCSELVALGVEIAEKYIK